MTPTQVTKAIAKTLFVICLLTISACGEWPRDSERLKSNFNENREAFEKLSKMIRASEFTSVRTIEGSDKLFVSRPDSFQLEMEDADWTVEWVDLLRQTNTFKIIGPMEEIEEEYDSVLFMQESDEDVGVSITHGYLFPAPLIACSGEFTELRCGKCGWELGESWNLAYEWQPHTMLEAEFDEYLKGRLDLEDYTEQELRASRECYKEGLTAIGYDVPEDFE